MTAEKTPAFMEAEQTLERACREQELKQGIEGLLRGEREATERYCDVEQGGCGFFGDQCVCKTEGR